MTYGCHNRELKSVMVVQNGWTSDGRRVTQNHQTDFEKWCRYDKRGSDPKCKDCKNV